MDLKELIDALAAIPEADCKQAVADAFDATKHLVWVPNPGPQTDAYFNEADELFYGGKAGGGKSDLILGAALTAHIRSLILRQFRDDAKDLGERLLEIVGDRNNWNGQDLIHRKNGRLIRFGGCNTEDDKQRFKGKPQDLFGFDEISDFSESQYTFIIGWNRSAVPGQRCRVIAAGNPPTRPEGLWVVKRWAAWLDPTHHNPAQPGELRWYTNVNGEDTEVAGYGPHLINGEEVFARSRTFIPADLSDNPDLADSGYRASLDSLPEEYRAAYRDGDFGTGLRDDPYQTIPTEWIRAAQARWTSTPPVGVPLCAMGVDVAQGGCFDDQTEILTDKGWLPFEQLNGTERVLTLNGMAAEWGAITQLHRYQHDGAMNLLDQPSLSFCITDNHNLLASTPKRQNWKLRRYDTLPAEFVIPRVVDWAGDNPDLITFESRCGMYHGGVRVKTWTFAFEDWARLLGWFVSEGCAFQEKRKGTRWRVNISQNRGPKFDRITMLLKNMGIAAHTPKSRPGLEFSINSIGAYLAKHCGVHAANKRIPECIRNARPEIIKAFLEEYRLGDGSVNGSGVPSYTTTSEALAGDLHEVLTKLGRAGKMRKAKETGSNFRIGTREVIRKKDVFTVTERSVLADCYVAKKKVQRITYKGFVYCVSTPLKTICVRRKGTVMWSGNSDDTALALRRDGWFDKIITIPGKLTPDGKAVSGHVVANRRDGAKVIIDLGGGWGGDAFGHLRENGVDTVGYMGVKPSLRRSVCSKYTFFNVRAQAYWQFREALDPSQEQGSTVCLPPDAELVADLCAPTYQIVRPNVIKIEAKEDLVKRLGRSPNRGDAVVMAWFDGDKISNRAGGKWKGRKTEPRVVMGRGSANTKR